MVSIKYTCIVVLIVFIYLVICGLGFPLPYVSLVGRTLGEM